MQPKALQLHWIKHSTLSVSPGSKHKTMLEARNGAGPIKAYPRPGSKLKVQATQLNKGSGLQNKTFHCEICDVHVNSEIQLKQVFGSVSCVLVSTCLWLHSAWSHYLCSLQQNITCAVMNNESTINSNVILWLDLTKFACG